MKLKHLLALSFLALGVGSATAALAADAAREIAITANDAMQFNVKEIAVKPGEVLTVKLSHVGKLPKTVMGHNWVLLKPLGADELTAFTMAAMSAAPDYIPEDQSAILAHTKVVGGGESATVTFTAPATPGEYPFICSYPGHYAMMKGTLIVK
jgi:azurin